MRLLRVQINEKNYPALLDAKGVRRSLAGIIPDIGGAMLSAEILKKLDSVDPVTLPALPADAALAPCLTGVGKVMAIGKNYPEHAAEMQSATPTEPILFLKATSAISAAHSPIRIPRGANKVDWEVELAVILGKDGVYIEERDAMEHVAGYCTAIDVSERAFQNERQGQWTKGKSADSFCPLGPLLATKDEVANPQDLKLWLEVNGTRMQDGRTRDMTYKIPFLIHYVSQFMSLQAGDVLLTGTPSGVGKGMNPPRFLKSGDRVRCGVEGLGEQLHQVI